MYIKNKYKQEIKKHEYLRICQAEYLYIVSESENTF